jgi:hypothetical protein
MIAHTALGVATFIPGVGSFAAVADAGLYAYQGDYVDAALSLMAVIPGGELLGKATELVHGGGGALKATEDVVKAGEDLERLAKSGEEATSEAERVSSTAEGAACSLSFSSDTKVAGADGAKTAISSLKLGDTVLAYDPKTGVTGPHTVSAVMTNLDPVVEHLSTSAGSIETTPNHPFFTADRGWIDAGSLRIGEKLRTDTGTDATVSGFTVSATPTTMWDITVDGAHSFFVGSGSGVLVHNASCTGGVPQGNPRAAREMANPPVGPREVPQVINSARNPDSLQIAGIGQDTGDIGNIAKGMGSIKPLPGGGGALGKLSQLGRIFVNFFGGN